MTTEAPRRHYSVTFAVLAGAVAAYALLQSLVIPVLPLIQDDLHTSQSTVTWVLTAYLLSASVFTPIMGRIGDMVGKKKILVVTMSALGLGSLIAAIAPNIRVLIAARAIQGIGGGVLPLSFGIVRDEYPREKISGAVGVIASLAAVGGGLGIVLAGPLVNALNYHWLFWLPMIICFLTAAAAHFVVPESPVRTSGRISVAPAVLLSGWLVMLLVALSEAPTWGWGSGKVLGLLAGTVVLIVAWVRVELLSASPLIDMRMMRLRAVWTTNIVALLLGVTLYSVFAFLPEFTQTPRSAGYGFGASITGSGLILLPQAVAMFLAGSLTGKLSLRWGSKWVIVAGSMVSFAGMLLMTLAHSDQAELFVGMGILGLGFGLVFAGSSSVIVAAVPASQTGVASGMNANLRTIGGSIGAALFASIVTSHPQASGYPREVTYTQGFALLAGAVALAAVVGLFIPVLTRPADVSADDIGPSHPELALVAGGTVVGDLPE